MRGRKDRPPRGASSARSRCRAAVVSLLLLPLPGCAGPSRGGSAVAPPPGAAGSPLAAPIRITPARFFPIGERVEQRFRAEDADGRARVVEHPDGRLERAGDLLPESGTLGVLSLPVRLGGGYAFWARGERVTDLFRARTWTSTLTPLVRLPFEVAEVSPGFDRLYALSAETRAVVGVDPGSGDLLGSEPLPPSAAYGAMAFSGSWLGAVLVDLRGALATFDAGATWHPVGAPLSTSAVTRDGERILLSTASGVFALGASGELERVEMAPGARDTAFGSFAEVDQEEEEEDESVDAESFRPPSGPLGAPPIEMAVLRGIPDSRTTAVVAANGTLARVDLSDGRIRAHRSGAVPSGATCQALRLGRGIGFSCGEDRGRTVVHALEPPLGLRPVLELGEPRRVLSSGNGAIVVVGGCPGSRYDALSYCVVPVEGAPWELRIQGDVGVERVVALADGRVVVLAPPRLGLAGTLTVLGRDKVGQGQALSLVRVPGDVLPLVSSGMWLDSMTEIESGVIGGWVVGSSSFVGVRVGLDGVVRVGTVRREFTHTSLSGPHALSLGEQGDAYETSDGGMVWTEVFLPSPELATAQADGERGCTDVGCGLGSWARVGWGEPEVAATAVAPKKATLDPSSIVTWSLECSATGVTAGPSFAGAARTVAPPGAATRRDGEAASPAGHLESSGWRSFLGVAAPSRGDALGFDFGTEDQVVQLRGYVWGERNALWDRSGTWLLRVADRFRVKDGVWSTSPSRPPWHDAVAAAEAFAADPSHRTSNEWGAVLDPGGEAGLLLAKTGAATELFAMHAGRAIVPVRNAADFSLEKPAGAVYALGRWFLGSSPGGNVLQLLSIDEGRVQSVGSYPRVGEGSPARVVRSSGGDAIGIWVTQRGHQGQRGGGDTWLVHPVDPESGALGPPLSIPRSALASVPRACEADEQGWVLAFEIGSTKSRVELVHMNQPPQIEHLEARLLASDRGLCADAFAARVDGDPPGPLQIVGAPRLPAQGVLLALTDRATDRRWEFRCTP